LAVVVERGSGSLAACPTPPAERWFASHELRTALQAIRGGLDLLLASAARGLSTPQLEAVSLISGAATDLERQADELAELWQLSESPPPPARQVGLQSLLVSPPVERWLTPQPGLVAAWDSLEVSLQPEVAMRAFARFRQLAGDDDAMPIDLIAVGGHDVALGLAVPPPIAGDRAIAWRLAQELCRHAGFDCVPQGEAGCTLTLQRVAAATASN
jgi:hypothetical protein